jgi:hypothetical protein
MSTPRFVDGTTASSDLLNDLLQTYMPLAVDWTMGPGSCTFQLACLTVRVENGAGMPLTASSDTMPRKYLDPLRQALRDILHAALSEPTWSTMGFGVMLLQMGEEALSHVEAFQTSQAKLGLQHQQRPQEGLPSIGWDATSSDWRSILSNPLGVSLLTVKDTAKFLLGKNITQILADLSSALRVLHVEPVFRNDLVAKFTRKRQEMRHLFETMSHDSLRQCIGSTQMRRGGGDSGKAMAEILSTPEVTFHGAPRRVMQSIVRYGFVIPGRKIGDTGKENKMACGATFGIGIYSSPSVAHASFYARDDSRNAFGEWEHPADVPGLRIVVCATLMGRPVEVTRDATRRTEGLCHEQADSHVSPNGMEYIVFSPAQIIPCYVLHLDYGSEAAKKHLEAFQKQAQKQLWSQIKLRSRVDSATQADEINATPAAKQANKEALKVAASNWFPHGYGPATGTNFVIEEIGEVSDDEEDYGEFQYLRGQWADEHPRPEFEKSSWFDEFQTVRKTKKQVLVE